jgi:hypothetical protein
VEAALKQWAALALAWAPPIKGEDNPARCPVEALRVSTGVGKSHAARVQAVAMVKDLRARGDDRCVGIAVPRHDLADEFVKNCGRKVSRSRHGKAASNLTPGNLG